MASGLDTKICDVYLKKPTILASGVLGISAFTLARVAEAGAGAVTTKSCCLNAREGHKNPTVIELDNSLINAMGLPNPGVDEEINEIIETRKLTRTPIIASIFGNTVEEFGLVAKKISDAAPNIIELNVSCPNVEGFSFGTSEERIVEVVKRAKSSTKIPVSVKLSPNVPDVKSMAKAAEAAGADAITAINTVGPGMVINIETGRPVLANKKGGLSGPAIKPIAVRCVYEIAQTVKIPIIGVGGITTGADAVEMIMAGATAVGIGSGVYYKGIDVFREVNDGIESYLKQKGYSKLEDIRGLALV